MAVHRAATCLTGPKERAYRSPPGFSGRACAGGSVLVSTLRARPDQAVALAVLVVEEAGIDRGGEARTARRGLDGDRPGRRRPAMHPLADETAGSNFLFNGECESRRSLLKKDLPRTAGRKFVAAVASSDRGACAGLSARSAMNRGLMGAARPRQRRGERPGHRGSQPEPGQTQGRADMRAQGAPDRRRETSATGGNRSTLDHDGQPSARAGKKARAARRQGRQRKEICSAPMPCRCGGRTEEQRSDHATRPRTQPHHVISPEKPGGERRPDR